LLTQAVTVGADVVAEGVGVDVAAGLAGVLAGVAAGDVGATSKRLRASFGAAVAVPALGTVGLDVGALDPVAPVLPDGLALALAVVLGGTPQVTGTAGITLPRSDSTAALPRATMSVCVPPGIEITI
jgi:hypothetical protein